LEGKCDDYSVQLNKLTEEVRLFEKESRNFDAIVNQEDNNIEQAKYIRARSIATLKDKEF
jgi:hypothetical protein